MDRRLTLEQLYDFIGEDDDEGSSCEAIPDEACREVPYNFFLNALNGASTKLGDQLANPSLVLPWLLDALGAPPFISGWLVPVRRAGALLPQLAIAGRIRTFARRKWFWAGGGFVFGAAILAMIPAVLALPPLWAGVGVVLALGVGSLGRGVSSVAFKDVLAKTIPKGGRGMLLATRATAAGILTLIAGLLLRLYVADETSLTPFVILLGSAGLLWFAGVALVLFIREHEGVTEGARNSLEQARAGWHLLQEKSGFRRFVLARILLLSVKLAVPFHVLYARDVTGGALGGLGYIVVATGLAEVLSSPFWGRFSDRSSRVVLMAGGSLAVVTGVMALLLGLAPEAWQTPLIFAFIFLLLGFARAGVRLGRKTYLVDGAPAEARPLYVAVTNTLVGAVTLGAGVLGLIAEVLSVPILLITFLLLMGSGILVTWRMPEAENMAL